jgi:integrase
MADAAAKRKAAGGGASLRELVVNYYASDDWRDLALETQIVRRNLLEDFCYEERRGEQPCREMLPKHIKAFCAAKRDKGGRESGNVLLKALRQVFKAGVESELVDDNPAAKIAYKKSGSDGYHSWTEEEIAEFLRRHPLGTKAHLALALLFYTGQRRQDVVKFGPHNFHDVVEEDGTTRRYLKFKQGKRTGKLKKQKTMFVPIVPELQEVLDASPLGATTFLESEKYGRSFSVKGFGNWFRKRCDEAGLKHCSAHGVRKATAVAIAEAGGTTHELGAALGHDTLRMIEKYSRAAQQTRLAASAFARLSKKHG